MPPGTEPERLLVLMAKQPKMGETKTRLSPPLDLAQAAAIYECFLTDKVSMMRRFELARPAVAYRPQAARAYFEQLAPDFLLIPQMGSNLAQSLCNVFEVTFVMGFKQVLAIDGDSPDLPPSYLRQAYRALDEGENDIALGPADDGGYYAIGMRELHRTLFEVEMSTARVFNETMAKAEGAGLTVASLPGWYDIDRPDDLDRLRDALASGAEERAQATAAFLERLDRDREA
jgi:rSAM/selenodomain-associated transferase 1